MDSPAESFHDRLFVDSSDAVGNSRSAFDAGIHLRVGIEAVIDAALFEIFKYLGVTDIGYNRPAGLPYPEENPFG